MATRILYEFISERRMTITDSIERCLKKGSRRTSYPCALRVFLLNGRGNADSHSCFCQARVRSSGRQLLWPASCASSWAQASKARRSSRRWNRSSKPSWPTDRPTSRPGRRWVCGAAAAGPTDGRCPGVLFAEEICSSVRWLPAWASVLSSQKTIFWWAGDLFTSLAWRELGFMMSAAVSVPPPRCRTCRLRWSALRTCSPGPMPERTGAVPPSPRRRASSTPTRCCPGRCCSPSARPASSKTSCASQARKLLVHPTLFSVWQTNRIYFSGICLNCRGCWRVMTSTWESPPARQSHCCLSWPETWTV